MRRNFRFSFVLFLSLSFILQNSVALRMSHSIEIEILPDSYTAEEIEGLKKIALASPELKRVIQNHRFRILETEEALFQAPKEASLNPGDIRFLGYDYDTNRFIQIELHENRIEVQRAKEWTQMRPVYPSPEEVDEAIRILENEPHLEKYRAFWKPYEAMPPLIYRSGAQSSDRILSVGILPETGAPQELKHEIVGVNLSQSSVIRFVEGAPPTSIAAPQVCAPKNAGQANNPRGVGGSATVRVRDDQGQDLWSFQVIRPSVSSGARGSGIDLRNLHYKTKKIASQIHTPIVNVRYARNRCGPYRDWQYSENPFQAKGTRIAPGILQAEGHPTTILESFKDAGNYRGVAISKEPGDVTRLVSEIAAGWYRYQVEYLFYPDGTFQPRWGFAAIQDSCTCLLHFHHAYWRMDFDLGESGDRVEVGDGTQWSLISQETKLLRTPSTSLLRVSNTETALEATIEPGESDGSADLFGRADAWVLRARPQQMDDSRVTSLAPIAIDRFVTRESVVDEDLVLWYGAHFRHDSDDHSESSHILGPTIRIRKKPSSP